MSSLIKKEEVDDILSKTITLILENQIKYKNIKWNLQMGYIEKINNLKYNDTKKEFYLEETIEKEKSTNCKPRSSSIKTIFTLVNEEIINEEILLFVINFIQSAVTLDNCTNSKKTDSFTLTHLKEDCLEHIKSKLKVKRLSILDKTELIKRFDQVYHIIKNNNSDEPTEITDM
mgnify:CR=1 FL=1